MVTSSNNAPVKLEDTPVWFQDYARTYQSGQTHAFILTGDIEGTAQENIAVRDYLLASLGSRRDVVAVYHLAGGITIYDGDGMAANGTTTKRGYAEMLVGAGDDAGAGAGASAPSPGGMAALLAQAQPQGAPAGDIFAAANSPREALPLLERLLLSGDDVAVVIDYADSLVPAPAMAGKGSMSPDDRRTLVTLLSWAKSPAMIDAGCPTFLLARELGELHGDIRSASSGWKAIDVPLPDITGREEYILWYLARRELDEKPIALLDDLSAPEIATLTAGLSLRNIEDIMLLAATQGGLSRALLKSHKDAIVTAEYSEVAEMIDPLPNGFADLGGMERLKAWFTEEVIEPVREGDLRRVPKGIMLVGPPGGGKTYLVRGLAKETGFSGVALNAANILGGIVGESERKLARFFAFAKSLAPVIVFVDELDQTDMASRGGSSGNPVAKNLFNAMLQFMSDETLRGKVIMVFASNRPDLMDPAIKRSGRMDAIIPVMLPSEAERAGIIAAQANNQGVRLDTLACQIAAEKTPNWSSADLGALIRKAGRYTKDCVTTIEIDRALKAIRPSGQDTAQFFSLLAIEACNDNDLLPPEYAALLNDRTKLTEAIQAADPAPRPRGERVAREDRF